MLIHFSNSYFWGDRNVTTKYITLDGRFVAVKANIDRALQWLRNPATNRSFLVDALCIDQSNLAEKMEQFRLMQSILKGCRCCPIWFGGLSTGLGLKRAVARFIHNSTASSVYLFYFPGVLVVLVPKLESLIQAMRYWIHALLNICLNVTFTSCELGILFWM